MAEEKEKETEETTEESTGKKPHEGKIKFDAQQTAFLNGLYNRAYGEGAEKIRKEAEAEKEKLAKEAADAKAERDKLAKELEDARKAKEEKEKEADKPNPLMDQIQARMAEMGTVMKGMREERDRLAEKVKNTDLERRRSAKKDAFLAAMKDANVTFFDPLEAYKLAEEDALEWDESTEKPIVKNKATGVAKLNNSGEPMTVAEYVKDFATRKNYLVKSNTQDGGTGSSSQRKEEKPETPAVDYSKMSAEDFEKARQEILHKGRQR